MGRIFVCKICKCGFYYSEKDGKDRLCDHCGKSKIEPLENYEKFVCPKCGREVEVLELEMKAGGWFGYSEDSSDSRLYTRNSIIKEEIDKGELRCDKCGTIMQWVPFENDEILEQEFEEDKDAWEEIIRQEFEEKKKAMQRLEAEILKAAGVLPKTAESRVKVKRSEIVPKTRSYEEKVKKVEGIAPPAAEARPTAGLAVKEGLSGTASVESQATGEEDAFAKFVNKMRESQIESKVPSDIVSDSSPFGAAKPAEARSDLDALSKAGSAQESSAHPDLISEGEIAPVQMPYLQPKGNLLYESVKKISRVSNEIWEYYRENRSFNPSEYFGGSQFIEKIILFLKEFLEGYLNSKNFDITRPLYEKINGGKIYVVGDTHGSFNDTRKLIAFFEDEIRKVEELREKGNKDIDLRIIFDGDYVDRNDMDIHNVLYIFSFAMRYPQYVRLLRGNHEEITINSHYGFRANVEEYLNDSVLDLFEEIFSNLPLMQVIEWNNRRILILHGGLPFYDVEPFEVPEIPLILDKDFFLDSGYKNIDDMDELSQQILWNDPATDLPEGLYYLPSRRGIGFNFGKDLFDVWMERNGIDRLIRAHEVFLEGFHEMFDGRLISIFSSSDYSGHKIKAKIVEIDLSKDWDKNIRYLTIQEDL